MKNDWKNEFIVSKLILLVLEAIFDFKVNFQSSSVEI